MDNIALAKKIEFVKGKKENQKSVIIEPCYPGYGITLGNALRRVLLSSLPGAAVIGVKIEGVSHEFMTLPNIKEDVLEIVLNLKQLRLKIFSDEVVKLELNVHGEKVVKASDITKNSQVEIINPDLIIANITDIAGNLNMEIFVSQGRGYEIIENREDDKHEIGYIEMDSIFSPILAVSVNVENVRVGKMTNWDKLILEITTDGTITPEEACGQAGEMLIEQFAAIIGKKKASLDKKDKIKEQDEADADSKKTKEEEDAKTKKEEKASPKIEEVEEDKPKKKRGRPKKN